MKALSLLVALAIAPRSVYSASYAANVESIFADHNEDKAPPQTSSPDKGVSESSYQKVNMVIETLKDILQSVKDEESQQSQNHEQLMKWCGQETSAVAEDLSDTKEETQEASVHSEEMESHIATLKANIAKDEKELEETKDAIEKATSLRHRENEEFTEDMTLNTQSLTQLDEAIAHVSSIQQQGGFLQNGVLKNLRINQPGDSNYVLGVMKGLKDKLEKSRKVMEDTESEKVHMYDDFMRTKTELQHNLEDSMGGDKIELGESEAHLTGVLRHISKMKTEASDLTEFQGETHEKCDKAEKEWDLRQVDRAKEKTALDEAIRYLEQSVKEKSLLQMPPEGVDSDDNQAVVFATSFLQATLSHKSRSFSNEDAEADEEQEEGPNFNAVKSVIHKMISYHQDTQKEETSKLKYCEKEIAELDDQKAETTDTLNAVSANIDKKETEVVSLQDEIDHLYASINEIKDRLAAALEIRKKEKASYEQGTKDRLMAIKILGQAKAVLQNFYDAGSDKEKPVEKAKVEASRKTAVSFGAVSMIQAIIDDVSKEQKDAAIEEKESHKDFEELGTESWKSTGEKEQLITDRTKTKAKTQVQLNSLKESKIQNSNDLHAIAQQLGALHSECDELLKSYDKRETARAFEVEQLRDVVDVLSGSSIAARTGFLEESAKSTAKGDFDSDDSDSEETQTDEGDAGAKDTEDAKEEMSLRQKEDVLMNSLAVREEE